MINEYHARQFCRDDISKIENYEEAMNDKTQTWHIHHRLELTLDGEFALSREQLKMHDMYYHRPYYELIFLTPTEHRRIHSKVQSRTEEYRRKISEANTGKKASEDTRRKMSESRKGKVPWNKGIHQKDIKATRKAYRQEHKEQIKAYYDSHKDVYKAKNKAYYQEHKEQIKAKRRNAHVYKK